MVSIARNMVHDMNADMCEGMAPKSFAYIDKKGRPVVVTIIQLLLGCLAFINLAPNGGTIFTWLLAFSGITPFFVFGSIALAHIRFRSAWCVTFRGFFINFS